MNKEEVTKYLESILDNRIAQLISYSNEIKDYDHEMVEILKTGYRNDIDETMRIKQYLKENLK